jgi:sialate O-acetylesterase
VEKEKGALRIKFAHAKGLRTKDPAIPGFVIGGADRRFYPARAKLDGETVLVSAKEVPQPVAVRYAWANDPPAPLYNAAGLPAGPFRSDEWDK